MSPIYVVYTHKNKIYTAIHSCPQVCKCTIYKYVCDIILQAISSLSNNSKMKIIGVKNSCIK